jgi:hypothetical protein
MKIWKNVSAVIYDMVGYGDIGCVMIEGIEVAQ